MGKGARPRPKHLAKKLRQIRDSLELSQTDIALQMGLPPEYRGMISLYETNKREPPLFVLLNYSHLSGVCLDDIVDDEVDLPAKMPVKGGRHQSESAKRRSKS